jgi:hypothetical protein
MPREQPAPTNIVADTESPRMVETLGPVVADTGVPSQDSMVPVLGGQEGEEQLINMFKSQELKYQECPTQPKETRRYIIGKNKIKPDNIHFFTRL